MNFFFENLEIPTIFLIFSLCQPPRKKNCATALRSNLPVSAGRFVINGHRFWSGAVSD